MWEEVEGTDEFVRGCIPEIVRRGWEALGEEEEQGGGGINLEELINNVGDGDDDDDDYEMENDENANNRQENVSTKNNEQKSKPRNARKKVSRDECEAPNASNKKS